MGKLYSVSNLLSNISPQRQLRLRLQASFFIMASIPNPQASVQLAKDVPTLKASIKEISSLVKEPTSDLDEAELPGLDRLIDDWYDPEVPVDEGEFMRRILGVFRESTHQEAFNNVVGELPKPQQDAISSFISGDSTAEDVAKNFWPQQAPVASGAAIPASNELHVEFSSLQASKPAKDYIKVKKFSYT